MENEQQSIKRRKLFMILIYVAIAFIAVAIWIFATVDTTPKDEAEISNIGKIDELKISNKLKSLIQASLYETIDLAYGIKDNKKPVADIRRESIKTSTQEDGTIIYSFIVDIDSYELTYLATVYDKDGTDISQAFFNCVEPAQSKYPKNFCIGYNGQSTIDVTIGKGLPISARETKPHRYIYNAKIAYKKKTAYPYIEIFTKACGKSDAKAEIRADFRDWISDLGYDPDLYLIEIPDYCSHADE